MPSNAWKRASRASASRTWAPSRRARASPAAAPAATATTSTVTRASSGGPGWLTSQPRRSAAPRAKGSAAASATTTWPGLGAATAQAMQAIRPKKARPGALSPQPLARLELPSTASSIIITAGVARSIATRPRRSTTAQARPTARYPNTMAQRRRSESGGGNAANSRPAANAHASPVVRKARWMRSRRAPSASSASGTFNIDGAFIALQCRRTVNRQRRTKDQPCGRSTAA